MRNTLIIANNSSHNYNNIVIFTITFICFCSGPGVQVGEQTGGNWSASVVSGGDWPVP